MRIPKNLSLDEETYEIANNMQGDFSAFVRRMLRTPQVPELIQRCEEWEAIAKARSHRIKFVERLLIDAVVHGKTVEARDHLFVMGLIDQHGKELV